MTPPGETARATTAPARGRTTRGWTLRRRLVVGVVVLTALAFAAAGVSTLLALRSSLYERLDTEVLVGLDLAAGPAQGPDGDPSEPAVGGDGPAQDAGPRPRVGTLHVVLDADGSVTESTYVGPDGTTVSLTANQLSALRSAELDDRVPTTVDLGGTLGDFRVAQDTRGGATVVSGISADDVTDTVTTLAGILALVMGVVLLLLVVAIRWLVARSLRPLERVAATAERAARRPLAEGDVDLPERAGIADDPRTEVGRVGASLDQLLNHVESALLARQRSEERLRRFVADASHELRTPLASIRGYAQLSQAEDAPMTPVQARSLDRIESEAARMGSLVDDLLLLARLDAGQPLRRDTVDLTPLVIDAVSDAHAADPSRTWLLDVDEPVEVPGDENRLRQVVVNLLGNARVHTPPGTHVRASVVGEDGRAVITVTDDGPGISADLQPRLFDRFTRGDTARSRDENSTGLGLSITHAVVTAHAGTITVASEPGRTTFTVTLPR